MVENCQRGVLAVVNVRFWLKTGENCNSSCSGLCLLSPISVPGCSVTVVCSVNSVSVYSGSVGLVECLKRQADGAGLKRCLQADS